jgi:outer membrane protein TolC
MKYLLLKFKKILVLLCFSAILNPVTAQKPQQLLLDSCYVYAEQNYPLVKQKGLIEKTTQYTLSNISKGYFPQFSIAGQATYQSDVTQIQLNGTLPPQLNIEFPTIDKDQYKIYGEIVQPLTDLANVRTSQKLTKASGILEEQKIEVELYKIRERINQLFLGIELLNEQLVLNDLLQKDIQTGIEKMNTFVQNGLALRTQVDQLEAELWKTKQYRLEIETARKGYLQLLSEFIGIPLQDPIELIYHDFESGWNNNSAQNCQRPELLVFDYQKNVIQYQNQFLNIKSIPRVSLFFQSGYGKPALNMLSPDFDFYYIGGVRLQWNLSSFYTISKEKKLINLQKNSVDVQKELFLFNNNLQLIQQQNEIAKYQKMLDNDLKIIALREKIKKNALIQLAEGTISANDYLIFINAEEKAKQDYLLHKMQMSIAIYQYQSIIGKK